MTATLKKWCLAALRPILTVLVAMVIGSLLVLPTGTSPLDSVTGLLSLARLALLIALAVVLVQIRRRGLRSLLLPAVLLIAWVAIGAAMTWTLARHSTLRR